MKEKEKQELLDCIHNLMGHFDTPVTKMQIPGKACEEVRQIAREILKKYNIELR